jgi:RNA polymerase sigma-70 factor (ECF subfamily)
MSFYSDIRLGDLLHQSDVEGINHLFERYWKLLYQIAVKKTGDCQEAEDIVQEPLIDIWH